MLSLRHGGRCLRFLLVKSLGEIELSRLTGLFVRVIVKTVFECMPYRLAFYFDHHNGIFERET